MVMHDIVDIISDVDTELKYRSLYDIPVPDTNQLLRDGVLVVIDAPESLKPVHGLYVVTEIRDAPKTTDMVNWKRR